MASEHEHDFREPIIERFPGGGMPSWELIAGYRCACGECASYRGTEAEHRRLFDPLYNAQTALRLYRAAQARRALQPWYGSRHVRTLREEMDRFARSQQAMARGLRFHEIAARLRPTHEEEQEMTQQTTLIAPGNPYRRDEGRMVEVGMPLMGYGVAGDDEQALDQTGPGLTAADIDHMVRKHWRAGRVRAERLAGEREEVMRERHRGELADAFDEGYTAGRVERAQGLARDFSARLVQLHFALMAMEQVHEADADKVASGLKLSGVRAQLDELMTFAEAMAYKPEVAAGQVARDES